MKKAISLILALVLCFALAMPSSAAALYEIQFENSDKTWVSEPLELYEEYEVYRLWNEPGYFLLNSGTTINITGKTKPGECCYLSARLYEFSEYEDYCEAWVLETEEDVELHGKLVCEATDFFNMVVDVEMFKDLGRGFAEAGNGFYWMNSFSGEFEFINIEEGTSFVIPESGDPETVYRLEIYMQKDGTDWMDIDKYIFKIDYSDDESEIPEIPEDSATPEAQMTSQALVVNGAPVEPVAYNIGGFNYFKLRDIAAMLNGTSAQFNVGYDAATATVSLTTGEGYKKLNGDLVKGDDLSSTCVKSAQAIIIDGVRHELTAYNIGNYNYFKLRDLEKLLGYTVGWSEETNTASITSN